MVKQSSFFSSLFYLRNVVAEIFHGNDSTVDSQSLNPIQESETPIKLLFTSFDIVFCYFLTNEKPDLFLSHNCISGLDIF